MPLHLPIASVASHPLAVAPPTPIDCDGPRDLIVDNGSIQLGGRQTFDRLCVLDGGTVVVTSALTLTVGDLYVAPHGAISADGQDGYYYVTHDCLGNEYQVDGANGGSMLILAHHADIHGLISASGGVGLSDGGVCSADLDGLVGKGGAGGHISLLAHSLALSGKIEARGGVGGDTSYTGTAEFPITPTTDASGAGGVGGDVAVTIVGAVPASYQGLIDVQGGAPGTPSPLGPTGAVGAMGATSIDTANTTLTSDLPSAPPAPIHVAAHAPLQVVLSDGSPAALHCNATTDLDVKDGLTVTLTGERTYRRVCVEDGGTLAVNRTLTLVAQAVDVAPGGRIRADGASPEPFYWPDTGRYATYGGCTADHVLPHTGARGSINDGALLKGGYLGVGIYAGTQSSMKMGGGGGSFTVIAHTVIFDGVVSAAGGRGADSTAQINENFLSSYNGGGGGAGGGIAIVAHNLRLGGFVTVAGGHSGHGDATVDANSAVALAGIHGSSGCIKLFAQTLAAPSTLPLTGTTYVAAPLPSDPVPPSTALGVRYFPQTHHTLAGLFLARWLKGGVAAFGYPETEPYTAGGVLMQYTSRARFELHGRKVVLSPLGRTLSAGRSFPRVAPFFSSPVRRYFPTTGHTLSSQFLTYWQTHGGVDLLGAPLSEVVIENNGDGTSQRYPTQWFERGRLEYHATYKGTPFAVQSGLLGLEALRQRGWTPWQAPVDPYATPVDGSVRGAHLYASTFDGSTFSSDGSRRWTYSWSGPTARSTGCTNILTLLPLDAGRTIYAGTCAGEVWGSHDAGRTWQEMDGGLPKANVAVFTLAATPDGQTIYANTALGLYKTNDPASGWVQLPLAKFQKDDTEPTALVVASLQTLWSSTAFAGLYKSLDGGFHWSRISGDGFPTAPNLNVLTVAVSPLDNADVYACTRDALYHSYDNGVHWVEVSDKAVVIQNATGGCFVGFDPRRAGRVYVSGSGPLAFSEDYGVHWTVAKGIPGASAMVFSRSQAGLIYALSAFTSMPESTTLKLYRTRDGGATWQPWSGGDIYPTVDEPHLVGYLP